MPRLISKFYLVYFIILFPSFCFAQIQITEISYSPQTKAWIEVYNNGDSSVDLSTYKILDSGAATNGHSINSPAILSTNSYAVIGTSGAVANFGQVSFLLFQSALKPNTNGDTFVLKDASKNVIDSKTFSSADGASGDGNSLQKISDGTWISTTPTPGAENNQQSNTNSNNNNSNSTTTSNQTDSTGSNSSNNSPLSSHSSFVDVSNFKPTEKFSVSIGRNRLTNVGIKTEFEAISSVKSGIINYYWSFGDGSSAEGKRVEHTFDFTGDYVVVLNAKYFDEVAVSRTNIKVVEAKLFVAEANPNFIKITNDSSFETNLYGWKIYFNGLEFPFPLDTIIPPKSSLEISSKLTGFKPENKDVVYLNTSKPNFAPKIKENNSNPLPQDKITEMYSKAKQIQSELSSIKELNSNQNINQMATPVLLIEGSTTSKISKDNWFNKFKRFLFGRN